MGSGSGSSTASTGRQPRGAGLESQHPGSRAGYRARLEVLALELPPRTPRLRKVEDALGMGS